MNLPIVRKVATAVLLIDLLALGAAAVEVNGVSSITTATPPTAQQAPTGLPAPDAAPIDVAAVPLDAGIPLGGDSPLPGAASSTDGTDGKADETGQSTDGAATKEPPAGTADGAADGPQASRGIPPCPIEVTSTTANGGLQSLVPFAPAFGPYSGEAFALASAYQPELQLLGPILAQYPTLEPVVTPVLIPLLTSLGSLLTVGYDGSAPLYEPYRGQLLEAETELAAALAPHSRSLAYHELGGCLVELEDALVAASEGGGTSSLGGSL